MPVLQAKTSNWTVPFTTKTDTSEKKTEEKIQKRKRPSTSLSYLLLKQVFLNISVSWMKEKDWSETTTCLLGREEVRGWGGRSVEAQHNNFNTMFKDNALELLTIIQLKSTFICFYFRLWLKRKKNYFSRLLLWPCWEIYTLVINIWVIVSN